MFSTLRQTFGDGDRLLNVEIVPPFDKDRMSMRTACERCRVQKSKCVSGEHGCMLCVAKNLKCEYSVVSRPRRRMSSVARGASNSRNDDNNTVVNQHKQSNQAEIHRRWSRVHTKGQPWPLSTQSSPSEDQMRVPTVSQPPLQDNSVATGPDVGLEDAQQLIPNGTLFPDSLGQISAVFPQLEPAAEDLYGNAAGPKPMTAAEIRAGRGVGVSAKALTSHGDSSNQIDHTPLHLSSSADSLFEFGFNQMDLLMDESCIPATVASSAQDHNKVTTEALPTPDSSTPPDSDSTFTSAASSCCCMMTAVSTYEALQGQLAWGDPITNPSAGSLYLSGQPWSRLDLGSETGTGASTYHSTPLASQQTILKRQKTILLRCDSLLRCDTCWRRPDFVMLMITMCDRILTSLEAVERFVCSRSDDISRVSSNGAAAVDIHAMTASRAGQDMSSLSRSSHVLQPAVGAWQIDSDDELELVIGLIKSRVKRLCNLIAMAEGSISANAWPSHERLVQALWKRSNKLLISLSSRGFH